MSASASRSLCLGLLLLPLAGVARGQSTPPSQSAPAANQPATPSSAEAADISRLRDQAQQEAAAGKIADAMRDYHQVLSLQPGWIEGWWNLGMIEYDGNQFGEAQSSFAKVTTLAPGFGNGWALLGLSEYEAGNYDDALAHLERAQSLGIRNDDEIARVSVYHLALLQIHAGEFDRAASLLTAAFGSGETPQQARIALGLAALRVPLLPKQVDPAREALLAETGAAVLSRDPVRFAGIVRDHPGIPYLHLDWCQALARAGKTRDAVAQCLAETRISPGSPLAWIEASNLQLLEGATAEALQSAQAAVRLAPSSSDAHLALARARQAAGKRKAPLQLPVQSPRGTAEQDATLNRAPGSESQPPEKRIVQLYASSGSIGAEPPPPAQWTQALSEYVAADYPAARKDLESWLAANPTNGTAWALLGLCDFALHDDENALIHLERGARLGLNASSQSIDEARYTYGILLVRARRFDEAEAILALLSDPASVLRPKVEFALGLALLRKAELPADASPAEADLIASAGRIAAQLEKSHYDEALPQFRALADRYPAAPFLHYAWGTALMAISEFDQAAAEMQAERKISPASELPCLRLASIALRQSNPAPAVGWAQCALDLAPDSVDAHYILGRAALETGDLDTATRQLEIAKALSPESPEIRFNLARAYARAKQPEKAQAEREAFSRLTQAQKSPPSALPRP